MLFEELAHDLHVRGQREQIRIADEQKVASTERYPTVDRASKSGIGSHLYGTDSISRLDPELGMQPVGNILGGIIVEDDDLDVMGVVLEKDRQRLCQQVYVSIRGYQDTDRVNII